MAEASPAAWRRAHRTLWTLILLFVLVWAVGKSWDERWHITHVFDTFWSPPHLFIYSGHLLVALLFLRLLFWMRDTHPHLGPFFRVPLLANPVPAPLLLMGFGFLFTGVAGLLDSKYHEALGLRETHWSLPHVMLGMSGLLTVMGFAAAFLALSRSGRAGEVTGGDLALRKERPLFRGTLPFAFWGMLVFALGAVLGPLYTAVVPQEYQAILGNRIPGVTVVLGDDLRWALQTYLDLGLWRSHWTVLPVAAFVSAALLSALRGLVPGRWTGTGWAIFFTALSAWDSGVAVAALRLYGVEGPAPGYVLPFPALFMVAAVALLEKRAGRWSYAAAGALAGAVWQAGPAGLLLGAAAALAGRGAGARLRTLIEAPTRRQVVAASLLLGVVVPLLLGGFDIALRTGKYWWVL